LDPGVSFSSGSGTSAEVSAGHKFLLKQRVTANGVVFEASDRRLNRGTPSIGVCQVLGDDQTKHLVGKGVISFEALTSRWSGYLDRGAPDSYLASKLLLFKREIQTFNA
jgi:hypothetical protein